jgi:hypothetical protein
VHKEHGQESDKKTHRMGEMSSNHASDRSYNPEHIKNYDSATRRQPHLKMGVGVEETVL